ncbi:hypothetical protein ACWCSD_43090 [Nonomuraea sp. NPDC001684]
MFTDERLVKEAGPLAVLGVALGVVPVGEHVGVGVGVDLQAGRCAVDDGGVSSVPHAAAVDDRVAGADAEHDRDISVGGGLLAGEQRGFPVALGEVPAEGLHVGVVAGGGEV